MMNPPSPDLLPEVRDHVFNVNDTDDTVEIMLTLFVPASLVHFAGHFPGLPLLPGVVQIDWAVRFARQHLPLAGDFLSMENLKFHSIVHPDVQVRLTLNWNAATGRLNFSYANDDGHLHSSGRLVFGIRTKAAA